MAISYPSIGAGKVSAARRTRPDRVRGRDLRMPALAVLRRLLGIGSLAIAAAVVALELLAVHKILGPFGALGWLVGAILLSVWVMFAVPFLMMGIHLVWGTSLRRGLVLSPSVPGAAPDAPAGKSRPSTLDDVWHLGPEADERPRPANVAPPPAEPSAPASQPPPYGLATAPMAAAVSLAISVTTLYLLLAPQ